MVITTRYIYIPVVSVDDILARYDQGVSRASTSVSWLNIGVDTAQLWA